MLSSFVHSGLARLVSTAALAVFALPAIGSTPTYVSPVPGGVTFTYLSGANMPINAGGGTWEYSAFNPAAYGDLYYAIGGYPPPGFNAGHPMLTFNNIGNDVLTFNSGLSNLAGGMATFTGTSTVYKTTGTQTVHTRFQLNVTDTSNTALALVDPSVVGLAPSLGAVLHVTANYRANWQFLASSSADGAFTNAAAYFNGIANKVPAYELLKSDVGGGFYVTPVPEPESYAMMLAGLGVVGFAASRRRRAVT